MFDGFGYDRVLGVCDSGFIRFEMFSLRLCVDRRWGYVGLGQA